VYFPSDVLSRWDTPLSNVFSWGFLGIGFLFWTHSYTAITWLSAGFFTLWHFWTRPNLYRTKFYLAYFVGLVPFVIVNGIFTGIATEQPIVVYNPEEYLGIRFFTIPIDDFVYNHLLCFMCVSCYEFFKQKKTRITQFSE
jgi:lycopene cyclase domain-containing protein